MKAVLLIALLSLFAACLAHPSVSDAEYQRSFTEWMHKHSKAYDSSEFQFRYDAFKMNVDFINNWDAEKEGFEVGLNHFADMTLAEFRRTYLGTKFTAKTQEERIVGVPQKFPQSKPVAADDSVDWRTKGYVTPIKNQGQCGSCWSFSTTGSTEGQWFAKSGTLTSLSEQQLVDCSQSFGNQGCEGGLMDDAFQYIIKNGIVSEEAYPYTAQDGTCNLSGMTAVAHLSSFKDVTQGSESDLTSAIQSIGPISVAIDASHSSFQLYSSGVYYEKQCSATQLDHGVLAVGYGTASGKDYYIVKNSWGTSWGMQGYINMSRNKNNNCGIATMASYPIV